jgi:kynurenine formamidase
MSEPVTREWLERVFEQVKNWGRWGPDDELGALNYVTPERRAAAARLVREGALVSCALDLAVEPAADNPTPAQHMMVAAGDARESTAMGGLEMSLDFFGVACHGSAVSHIDALCHVFVRGKMYNGRDASEVKSIGALRNAIGPVAAAGIAGRGVLLDVPRLRGVEWLELSDRIPPNELVAAERAQGVEVREGDLLLVSTGRAARRAARGPWVVPEAGMAGLLPTCIPWLHERRVALLGTDGFSDPIGDPPIEGWPVPIHQCCLVAMGVHLLDNLDLRGLAAACAERRRWEFFFVVQPLRIARGTGSPVNPAAIF